MKNKMLKFLVEQAKKKAELFKGAIKVLEKLQTEDEPSQKPPKKK